MLWQPAVVAVLFILGQVTTLVSLTRGDISVSAPVLGLKLLFVPLFIWLLGAGDLPRSLWIACGLSALAVVLLNYSQEKSSRERALFSLVTAASGAAAYALFDVCIQLFTPQWDDGGLLPVAFLFSCCISVPFVRAFEAPLSSIPRAGWFALAGSSVLFAIQAMGIVGSVAGWGEAAISNVVYSSRGLWSLLLVAWAGRWLTVQESGLNGTVLRVRVCGALLLFCSIGLLLVF